MPKASFCHAGVFSSVRDGRPSSSCARGSHESAFSSDCSAGKSASLLKHLLYFQFLSHSAHLFRIITMTNYRLAFFTCQGIFPLFSVDKGGFLWIIPGVWRKIVLITFSLSDKIELITLRIIFCARYGKPRPFRQNPISSKLSTAVDSYVDSFPFWCRRKIRHLNTFSKEGSYSYGTT